MSIVRAKQAVKRSRVLYACLGVSVLIGGLILRSRFAGLSGFAAKYGGDSLWALLVFCGLAFAFQRLSTLRVALIALAFAYCIEFSQIYHASWIDEIRSTRLGALVLGSTFNWPDLVAYAVGICVGAFTDGYTCKRDEE